MLLLRLIYLTNETRKIAMYLTVRTLVTHSRFVCKNITVNIERFPNTETCSLILPCTVQDYPNMHNNIIEYLANQTFDFI